MKNRKTPFSAIGKRTTGTRGYLFDEISIDNKLSITSRNEKGSITLAGIGREKQFLGNISADFGNTAIDMDVGPEIAVGRITMNEILPCTQAAVTYNFDEKKYGGQLSATMDDNEITYGGELGFDGHVGKNGFASVTKCNVGVGIHVPNDFSAAVILVDKGKTLKTSFKQTIFPALFKNFSLTVGGGMTRDLVTNNDSINIGTCFSVLQQSFKTPLVDKAKFDILLQNEWTPYNYTSSPSFAACLSLDHFTFKTQVSGDEKETIFLQREWRPNSFATFSMERDLRTGAPPKFGFSLAF